MIKQQKEKRVEQLLSELDTHLVAGEIRPLLSTITQLMGSYFLRRFRERKMILRAPVKSRRDIALCLLSCAVQLKQQEYECFENYLEFSIAADMVRRQLLKEIHGKISSIGSCCDSDFLNISHEIYNSEITRMAKYSFSSGLSGQVAEDERRLHDLNGCLVDLSNGLARLLNETSRVGLINNNKRPYKRRERKHALAVIRSVLTTVGQLNALEWSFDEVSFGHFCVVESSKKGSAFKLDFTDARMALMRRLATRRSFILKFMDARTERYVRNELMRIKDELLNYALKYCCSVAGISGLNFENIEKAQQLVRASLAIIDTEDDLLFSASRGNHRVQAYYVAGLALTCFAIASSIVADVGRSTGLTKQIIEIPLSIITGGVRFGTGESLIAEGLAALSVSLPARSHNQLNALPFVRDRNNVVRPFLHGFSGMWNIMVRNALIQGGTLGKDIGAVWEEFIEFSFKDTAWRILGKGIKLRRGGQVVTDVDLLLLQNDLLLVIQIKSLIGSADTAYDHWKNRQIVEMGCMQARKSADFLTENSDILVSICGKKASDKIRIIQPLVLTNINHLEGFCSLDVPVIGEATRKAICRGSKVDYFRSNGQHIHSHIFVAPDQLNTNEILRLLKEPVELHIASEKPETFYRRERLGNLELGLPEFQSVSHPFQPVELEVMCTSSDLI